MPKPLPTPPSRVKQIKDHNRKALAENRPDDVLPEQSTTRIWEPHEWNAELAKRAKARGERPNIPGAGSDGPRVPKGYAMLTTEPEMRDPKVEAAERAEHIRKGARKPFKGGLLKSEKPDPA
jgi:hypothetical protein